MRLRDIVFMAVVMVFLLSSPAASQNWVDVKDPKELRALHSNKTFRYTSMQVPVVEHYRADGKGIWITAQQRAPITWEVKGDQVCIAYPDQPLCWDYQRSKKNPDEYVRRCQSNAWMAVVTVENGIPEF